MSNATSKTFGGHTLRFGLQAQFRKFEHLTDNSTRGNFTFNGNFTGNAVADYLLGYCSTCAGAFGASARDVPLADDRAVHRRQLAGERQADASSSDCGGNTSRRGRSRTASKPRSTPTAGKIGYNALPTTLPAALVPLVIQQEHYFPDGILQKDLNNWGPRVGVAYNLTDRTVLRCRVRRVL